MKIRAKANFTLIAPNVCLSERVLCPFILVFIGAELKFLDGPSVSFDQAVFGGFEDFDSLHANPGR